MLTVAPRRDVKLRYQYVVHPNGTARLLLLMAELIVRLFHRQ
jgi:hypothetical protein